MVFLATTQPRRVLSTPDCPACSTNEGLDYELDTSTGFWRRKATAASRPPNLPGPGQSHWTPDLREPPNMYREQREAMQRVYADRSRRRMGQDRLPPRDILAAEYEIQLRNAEAV